MKIYEDSPGKLFTLEQANKMLPLIRRITEDIAATFRRLVEQHERCESILHDKTGGMISTAHREELDAIGNVMEKDKETLAEYVNELNQLGVELKGPADGLIDFPCAMDDRIVYLCWKLGEPEIQFWHELDAGFQGRQPLCAHSSATDGEYFQADD